MNCQCIGGTVCTLLLSETARCQHTLVCGLAIWHIKKLGPFDLRTWCHLF
jgi:hypothetical protein